MVLDRVYFDHLVNFAGFQVKNKITNATSQIGERYEQVFVDLPYRDPKRVKIVGFRSSKQCYDSKVIESIQIIYLSKDYDCLKYLEPLLEIPPQDFSQCNYNITNLTVQDILGITGLSEGELIDTLNGD
jgi:hypothetical protein